MKYMLKTRVVGLCTVHYGGDECNIFSGAQEGNQALHIQPPGVLYSFMQDYFIFNLMQILSKR